MNTQRRKPPTEVASCADVKKQQSLCGQCRRLIPLVCSSNKFNALIAQLVEQLICNHQVRGSSPRGGTRIKRAWRRDNVPGFHPGVKGLIPLVRTKVCWVWHDAVNMGVMTLRRMWFDSTPDSRICRGSSEVEWRSHKPLVGGSIPPCGTSLGM